MATAFHLSTVVRACSLFLTLAACSVPDTDELPGNSNAACATVTNVSDGPTADNVADSATTLICYYRQPTEGYCRRITDPATLSSFYSNGKSKGSIGCADAVLLTDTVCPSANAVGSCLNNTIETERVYYTCSKFQDPEAHCAQIGGTYTAR